MVFFFWFDFAWSFANFPSFLVEFYVQSMRFFLFHFSYCRMHGLSFVDGRIQTSYFAKTFSWFKPMNERKKANKKPNAANEMGIIYCFSHFFWRNFLSFALTKMHRNFSIDAYFFFWFHTYFKPPSVFGSLFWVFCFVLFVCKTQLQKFNRG